MFERNRIDQAHREGLPVEMKLDDGSVLCGHLLALTQRALGDELNSGGSFVEFETADRQRVFIAKSSIRSIRSNAVPKADALDRRLRQSEGFDPFAILGLPKGADREAVRQAYHRLAKAYHPDRLQAAGLPAEMHEYAVAMTKRINAAYSVLQGGAPAGMARA
jgi:DnaJ-domain-containing protein 1